MGKILITFCILFFAYVLAGDVDLEKKLQEDEINHNECLASVPILGEYGLKKPEDTGNNATFCFEHSPNTCCNKTDTEFIRKKMSKLRVDSSNISNKCAEISTMNFCSLCDRGVSTGIIQGLCPHQCSEWYEACKDDFFAGGMEIKDHGVEENSFCSKFSPTCTKVKHIYENPTDFCTQMGFTVNFKNDRCYDGISWVEKKEKAKKPEDEELCKRIFKFIKHLFIRAITNRKFKYTKKF
ncbi:unnamed protein product [Moneuplotes crassus]|uniref:Folate receptor-like domain-containing protein n=1 Tax=Euplotes crassus TaxID=5936 RepID=A0AAD1UNI3_EUPCR|nr:unnamed protein product [Moneuplotes crassus]